jgi:hypothetical protein
MLKIFGDDLLEAFSGKGRPSRQSAHGPDAWVCSIEQNEHKHGPLTVSQFTKWPLKGSGFRIVLLRLGVIGNTKNRNISEDSTAAAQLLPQRVPVVAAFQLLT